jgi:hypothetical protein
VAVDVAQPSAIPTPLNIGERQWRPGGCLPFAIESRATTECQGEEQNPTCAQPTKRV